MWGVGKAGQSTVGRIDGADAGQRKRPLLAWTCSATCDVLRGVSDAKARTWYNQAACQTSEA